MKLPFSGVCEERAWKEEKKAEYLDFARLHPQNPKKTTRMIEIGKPGETFILSNENHAFSEGFRNIEASDK